MSAERLKSSDMKEIVISRLKSGWPEKVVYLIKLPEEKASLVIPEGVKVRLAPSKEEMEEIEEKKKMGEWSKLDEETFWSEARTDDTLSITESGKFLAKDLKTGKTKNFEVTLNSDYQKQAA